jgi:phage/plasmid primase-like uncharacterized protein
VKVWDGPGGKVYVHGFAADDWRDIKAKWREQGVLPEWQGTDHRTDAEMDHHRQQARERQHQRGKEELAEAARKSRAALDIWRDARPTKDSLVEIYLRGRGITIEPPLSLRYANLKHGPTGAVLPAIVAAVQCANGNVTGIHRTFLTADGRKKAPDRQAKMMFGRCIGGGVRLALAKDRLCVGEGIETMLSVQQETKMPCWAALSTTGLKALILPHSITRVTICADADDPGEKAAQSAAQRWQQEGREVRIARPPSGSKDFSDALHASTNTGNSE